MATAALAAALSVSTAQAETVKIALVVKALGIGFFEAANKGAQEAAKELGNVEVIYTGPTATTAEAQIEVINALIAQNVNAIAVSANDKDALVPGAEEGDEPRHHGDLLGFGRRAGRTPDAPQPLVQRADRQYVRQDGGR